MEVVLRPEGLRLLPADEDDTLAGVIEERRFTGEATFYLVRLPSEDTLLVKGELQGHTVGELVGVGLNVAGPRPRSFPAPVGDTE